MGRKEPSHQAVYKEVRAELAENIVQVAKDSKVDLEHVAKGMGMDKDRFFDFLCDGDMTLRQLCKLMRLLKLTPYIIFRPL